MYFLNNVNENNDFALITKAKYFVDKSEFIVKYTEKK